MSMQTETHDRTIEAKIERLRQRLAKAANNGKLTPELAAVLAGFLDLMADEL